MADDFENFRKICLKIYLDPVKFISAPGSGAEVKLELLTDVDMLLMVEKGIRGVICYSVYRYKNDSNKYIDYDKNKEPSYLKY